ncbi:MAG: PEGA domain-containing protein [Candidatus Neomarinimicrobiota bacterium]
MALYNPLGAYSLQQAEEIELINVAVIDLEGKGISQLEASTLTDRLRTSLVQTGKVNVLERGMMEDILQETGFQQTGCVSTECAIEVGKVLGVRQIISGGIGKLGSTYTVDVRIIDVETSKILKVTPRDYTGNIDGLLSVIREIAFDLVSAEPSAARPVAVPEPVGIFGVVEAVSTPTEATVYIDGIKLGLTPFKLGELKAGEHTIKMAKSGHIDYEDTFSLAGGETKKLEAILVRLNVLNLSSTPSGATFYLNDELKGVTPLRLELKTGSYRLKLKKEGYADLEEEVTIDKNVSKNMPMAKAEKGEEVVEKKRSNKLLWISLGAVAAGGAAYYFLLQPPEEDSKNATVTVNISIEP